MRRLFLAVGVWVALCIGAVPAAAEDRLADFLSGAGTDSMGVVIPPELDGPRAAMSIGDYAAAVAELKDIVRRDSSHTLALRLLASAYSHLDAEVQAIQVCRRISAIDSADAGVEVALGYFHQRLGDFDVARYHYRQALGRNPDAIQAYLGLAWMYLQRRQLEPALEMVTRVTEQAPNHALAYLLMGRILTAQGFFSDAAVAYRRTFALRPELRERYGILLQELTIRHHMSQ